MNTQDIISNEQVSSLERIAAIVAKSGMGGFKTPEQATVAMLLALAEGIPLGRIIHEYHVINGRLSLRSECMLARFQRAGGIIKYIEHTETCVSVTASHLKGGALTVTLTLERARKAGLTSNPTWQKHPAAMLTARAIAEAVRAVYPACLSGIITEDEAVEITPAPTCEPMPDFVPRTATPLVATPLVAAALVAAALVAAALVPTARTSSQPSWNQPHTPNGHPASTSSSTATATQRH